MRMHSLNIEAAKKHSSTSPSILSSAPLTAGSTPIPLNTPDIINSLINPFFEPSSASEVQSGASGGLSGVDASSPCSSSTAVDDERKTFATLETPSSTAAAAHGATSRAPPPRSTVPSVSATKSDLIKATLKVAIQTKRKSSGKEDIDYKSELETKSRRYDELTPEDEERRKRRRERNKVAATKCRNKKKEKTCLLVQESESLEDNNISLKSEISRLERERQCLMDILAAHAPKCKQNLQNYNNHCNIQNYYDQAIQL